MANHLDQYTSGIHTHILLIDDDTVDQRAIERLLRNDYEFSAVDNEGSAIERLTQNPPDCVLLDFNIPGVDTLDLLSKFTDKLIPVIMLTGAGSESIAVEAMKRGAYDYLTKNGIAKQPLMRAISLAIEKTRLQLTLLEKQRELEDFVSIATHDLKSPLNSLSQITEELRFQLAEGTRQEVDSCIANIDSRIRHMQKFIDELLKYTRVGRSEKPFEVVDLEELAGYVVSLLEGPIAQSGATVEIGAVPKVMGDWTGLLQLFQNLIANAVKFRRDEAPTVSITAERKGAYWQIAIKDNGVGIDPHNLTTIFAPLARAHRDDEFEGTGLGLAACAKIVKQHRGSIWVDSTPGIGSTFYFTLPYTDNL